jgi:hypothetical protein
LGWAAPVAFIALFCIPPGENTVDTLL